MNQVERRQREQLHPEEVALLMTCGGKIRKGDHQALALARSNASRPTTHVPLEPRDREVSSSDHLCKAREPGSGRPQNARSQGMGLDEDMRLRSFAAQVVGTLQCQTGAYSVPVEGVARGVVRRLVARHRRGDHS